MAEFNLVQAVFDRSLLSPNEDVAVITMHIRKHIALAPDVGPIDDTIRADFTTKFTTFWNAIRSSVSNKITCRELRYYDVPSGPGIDMGAPAKVSTIAIAGSSTGTCLPPQNAISVTFKAAERKHWGRFYLPGWTLNDVSLTGRLNSATCTSLATAAAGLCSKSGTGANLTIFSRTLWNDVAVTAVQVDDIIDVIRRRRFSFPTVRANVTV